MKTFKDDVLNKSHPEGSIAYGYLLQETLTYCTEYKGLGNSNILTKLEKSLDGSLFAPPDLLNVIDYTENDDKLRTAKNVDINFADIVRGPSYYANRDHTMHSLDSNSAVADTARNIPSRTSSSSRRRGPSQGSKPLPDGKKMKVGVNSWGQLIRGVNSCSTTIGTLTRNHIPINYKKFTNVPDEFIHIMKTEQEMTFDLRCVAIFSIMRRMNDAWKRHKYRLNKKYIKGKDLAKVVERNVPDENVGRADIFIKAHTKADKTYQCPKIIKKLQENMILYPDSNKIGHDDVFTKTLGKDKKDHMMDMGIDITPSFVANAIHIVKENVDLKATNNELKTMLLNMQKDLDDHIKKTSGYKDWIYHGEPFGGVCNNIMRDDMPDHDMHHESNVHANMTAMLQEGMRDCYWNEFVSSKKNKPNGRKNGNKKVVEEEYRLLFQLEDEYSSEDKDDEDLVSESDEPLETDNAIGSLVILGWTDSEIEVDSPSMPNMYAMVI
ncbi:hypothetical protein GIB67_033845 [Kingdonia uniflora]|uniref:Uncharacterized protein n=1 Tax=Kingdonia uniflora TaxID=39325 RepID=A0A7J7LIQ4_9MAGN|nr:hypothetical protein GIB67_033845 [Kingdonia uniflora]